MQPAAGDEYPEKYSRGRRGAPAKGVGRLYRRESSNLSFSAKGKALEKLEKPSDSRAFLFLQKYARIRLNPSKSAL